MTFSITLGWWLAPLVFTVIAFTWAMYERKDERPTGGMFDWHGLLSLFRFFSVALPASLIAWLMWALIR